MYMRLFFLIEKIYNSMLIVIVYQEGKVSAMLH
jgi:hypothetical protein